MTAKCRRIGGWGNVILVLMGTKKKQKTVNGDHLSKLTHEDFLPILTEHLCLLVHTRNPY